MGGDLGAEAVSARGSKVMMYGPECSPVRKEGASWEASG